MTCYRRDALPLPPRAGIAPFTGGKVGMGAGRRDAVQSDSDLMRPHPNSLPLAGEGAVPGYRRDALPLPPRAGIAPFTGGKVGMGAGRRDAIQSNSDLMRPTPALPRLRGREQ